MSEPLYRLADDSAMTAGRLHQALSEVEDLAAMRSLHRVFKAGAEPRWSLR